MPDTLTRDRPTRPEQEEIDSREAVLASEATLKALDAEAREIRSTRASYALFFSFMAVLLAVAALLAVAFKLDNGRGQTAMPVAGSAAAPPAAGGGTVNVELGEMFVRPSVDSVSAGSVTFVARNAGQLPHELMVEPAPIKLDAPGQPTEDAAMGMIQDMQPMHGGRMTVNLKPGRYELFCNLPGHYAAGQHASFTVTNG